MKAAAEHARLQAAGREAPHEGLLCEGDDDPTPRHAAVKAQGWVSVSVRVRSKDRARVLVRVSVRPTPRLAAEMQ